MPFIHTFIGHCCNHCLTTSYLNFFRMSLTVMWAYFFAPITIRQERFCTAWTLFRLGSMVLHQTLEQLYSLMKTKAYGGPWVSRHNQISRGTNKYLTAKTNSSRRNQIINRKTKNSHGKSK